MRRAVAVLAALVAVLAACGSGGAGADGPGRETTRPPAATSAQAAGGVCARRGETVEVGDGALLHLPAGGGRGPWPLVIALHGAGGNAESGLDPLLPFAAEFGAVLLSPESRGATWDVIRGGFGPDVTYLDRALALAFDRQAVDPARIAVSGFSDGASYALSIGLTNGELFSTVIAFSPGFAAPGPRQGDPQVFVSHGVADPVLPIDRCSRRIVPQLERDGYAVRYREFEGGHVVPADLARESLTYFSEAAEQTGET